MKIQKILKILLSAVAITAIGGTAVGESHLYTSPPTTVLDVKTADIPRGASLEATVLVATIAPRGTDIRSRNKRWQRQRRWPSHPVVIGQTTSWSPSSKSSDYAMFFFLGAAAHGRGREMSA